MNICAGWHPISNFLHKCAQPAGYPNTCISNVTLPKSTMLSYNYSTSKPCFYWTKAVVTEPIHHPKACFTDFLSCYSVQNRFVSPTVLPHVVQKVLCLLCLSCTWIEFLSNTLDICLWQKLKACYCFTITAILGHQFGYRKFRCS